MHNGLSRDLGLLSYRGGRCRLCYSERCLLRFSPHASPRRCCLRTHGYAPPALHCAHPHSRSTRLTLSASRARIRGHHMLHGLNRGICKPVPGPLDTFVPKVAQSGVSLSWPPLWGPCMLARPGAHSRFATGCGPRRRPCWILTEYPILISNADFPRALVIPTHRIHAAQRLSPRLQHLVKHQQASPAGFARSLIRPATEREISVC